MSESQRILSLLAEAKRIAKQYYELTGRPLGVTGEIGEYEAVRLLGLRLADVRQAGYDAVAEGLPRERFQIKTRVIFPGAKPGQRIGRIDISKVKEWDAVLLVLLNADYETTAIYRAERNAVQKALLAPGSRSRNERGALGVAKFKAIGKQIWPPRHGAQR